MDAQNKILSPDFGCGASGFATVGKWPWGDRVDWGADRYQEDRLAK